MPIESFVRLAIAKFILSYLSHRFVKYTYTTRIDICYAMALTPTVRIVRSGDMMKVSSVRIVNFKSFADTGEIQLGKVNVLVGRNNHGKSAFIRAVHLLQQGAENNPGLIRLGANTSEITFGLDDATGLSSIESG